MPRACLLSFHPNSAHRITCVDLPRLLVRKPRPPGLLRALLLLLLGSKLLGSEQYGRRQYAQCAAGGTRAGLVLGRRDAHRVRHVVASRRWAACAARRTSFTSLDTRPGLLVRCAPQVDVDSVCPCAVVRRQRSRALGSMSFFHLMACSPCRLRRLLLPSGGALQAAPLVLASPKEAFLISLRTSLSSSIFYCLIESIGT